MAEIKLRFNLDAEEVELVVDGEVALSSGKEVFENWVGAYNAKHKPVEAPVTVEAPVAPKPVVVEEPAVVVPVNENVVESQTVETSTGEVVDTAKED